MVTDGPTPSIRLMVPPCSHILDNLPIKLAGQPGMDKRFVTRIGAHYLQRSKGKNGWGEDQISLYKYFLPPDEELRKG